MSSISSSSFEFPHQFVAIAAANADSLGDADLAAVFYSFVNRWSMYSEANTAPVSWKAARTSQVGRSVITIAYMYVNIFSAREAV